MGPLSSDLARLICAFHFRMLLKVSRTNLFSSEITARQGAGCGFSAVPSRLEPDIDRV
jgi:hypothetical protein